MSDAALVSVEWGRVVITGPRDVLLFAAHILRREDVHIGKPYPSRRGSTYVVRTHHDDYSLTQVLTINRMLRRGHIPTKLAPGVLHPHVRTRPGKLQRTLATVEHDTDRLPDAIRLIGDTGWTVVCDPITLPRRTDGRSTTLLMVEFSTPEQDYLIDTSRGPVLSIDTGQYPIEASTHEGV